MAFAHGLVEHADEFDGVEVFLGPVFIEDLLPGVVDPEVEVEHAGDAVHADAVGVVFLQPEQGVGEQEAAHLAPSEIEFIGAPLRVVAFFVKLLPVEPAKAVLVPAEMAGGPVQDDPQTCLVAAVDEVHERLGFPIAGRGRVEARDLIAPGTVEGMLHHRKQFQVGVAHFGGVRDQRIRQFAVAEKTAVLPPAPGSEMDLVDVQRALSVIQPFSAAEPLPVAPRIAVQIIQDRGGLRRPLRVERVGIRLIGELSGPGFDHVFVSVSGLGAGNEQMPYAVLVLR